MALLWSFDSQPQETCHNSLLADIIRQMPEPDNIPLLRQHVGGDESAFTRLFERYVHPVYSTRLPVFRHWPSPKPLVLPRL